MPRGPDKASGKGFGTRRKASKTAEEIKEETEEEAEEEKCVASTSAVVEAKVGIFCCGLEISSHNYSTMPPNPIRRITRRPRPWETG